MRPRNQVPQDIVMNEDEDIEAVDPLARMSYKEQNKQAMAASLQMAEEAKEE